MVAREQSDSAARQRRVGDDGKAEPSRAERARLYFTEDLPWVGGALDGLLAVLPPRVLVRRDVRDLGADRRHSDGPLHAVFPVNRKNQSSGQG
jgi:hypothetical protein